jgi:hypothetical protein
MSQQNTLPDKAELWMDSGAFTAWTRKEQINLDEYIQFCLDRIDIITYVVNLDVIPGEFGQKNLPPEEIERSAALGYQNYRYMLSKGIPKDKLIHVFHQGEDFKWLKKLVAEIPYIGLSPANDRTTEEKMMWLDQCMPYVTNEEGYPIVKFHGFAVTSLRLMLRFPWYSVDSTSWQMHASYGHIIVPILQNGQYNYEKNPLILTISKESPQVKNAGKHFDTLPPMAQHVIVRYIESKDFTLEEVQSDYLKRSEMNVIYFKDLTENMTQWPNKKFTRKTQAKGFGL